MIILDPTKLSIKWKGQVKTFSFMWGLKDSPSMHSFSGNYERMYFIKTKGEITNMQDLEYRKQRIQHNREANRILRMMMKK